MFSFLHLILEERHCPLVAARRNYTCKQAQQLLLLNIRTDSGIKSIQLYQKNGKKQLYFKSTHDSHLKIASSGRLLYK